MRVESRNNPPRRKHLAVTPIVRRAGNPAAPARHTGNVDELVADLRPDRPLYVLRPDRLARAAKEFLSLFPGDALYAVKVNPDKTVIQTLYRSGVKSFDVASIDEVRLAAKIAPKAKLYFMHPVKSPEAVREAYFTHGVRAFVLDTEEELFKIVRETGLAVDLELFVRLSLPKNGSAAIDFSPKFGAKPEEAAKLLVKARSVASRLGLCFHVGTQTADPAIYARAIAAAASVLEKSKVAIDVLDIGGGFPVPYPGEDIPPLSVYMDTITEALLRHGLSDIPLLAEPGRVLTAQAGSLVVRVEQRRGDTLYINDGTYGGLFDAGAQLKTRYPVRAIYARERKRKSAPLKNFSFAGPTCDSIDMMPGPFALPADIATGDWIEIGNTGAYSAVLRSNFNGFGQCLTALLVEKNA